MVTSKIVNEDGDWDGFLAGIVIQACTEFQNGVIMDVDGDCWSFDEHDDLDHYNYLGCYVMFRDGEEFNAVDIAGCIYDDNTRQKEDALDALFLHNVGRFIACVFADADDGSCIQVNIFKHTKTDHYFINEIKTNKYGEIYGTYDELVEVDVKGKYISELIDELRERLKECGKVSWNINTN